jgi:hypothetical protein
MVLNNPKRKDRRAAKDVAQAGKYDSDLEIKLQLNRRHTMRGEGRKWEREVTVVDWIHQARSKGKVVGSKFTPQRSTTLATVAVSYKLRARELYWWPRDLAFYIDAWHRGHLTDNEIEEFIQWVNHCA